MWVQSKFVCCFVNCHTRTFIDKYTYLMFFFIFGIALQCSVVPKLDKDDDDKKDIDETCFYVFLAFFIFVHIVVVCIHISNVSSFIQKRFWTLFFCFENRHGLGTN